LKAVHTRRAGMTLVEIVVAICVLLVGVLGFVRTIASLQRVDVMTRETAQATEAARAVMERISAEAFAEAFRRYNSVPSDDPGGAGTAPGATFSVDGLSPIEGATSVGEVIFPVDPAAPAVLDETITDPELGMPRDLNGDGDDDDAGISTTYKVLPVIVRVRWRGASGPGSISLRTMLGNY
jgi:type II secretory pathway pseudopilin PulG